MLTIFLKTTDNTTNNNTLARSIADTNTDMLLKSIANTNTNTFVTILFTVFTFSKVHCFLRSSINKVNKMTVVKKTTKSL